MCISTGGHWFSSDQFTLDMPLDEVIDSVWLVEKDAVQTPIVLWGGRTVTVPQPKTETQALIVNTTLGQRHVVLAVVP